VGLTAEWLTERTTGSTIKTVRATTSTINVVFFKAVSPPDSHLRQEQLWQVSLI
jgi:hypothetical protein